MIRHPKVYIRYRIIMIKGEMSIGPAIYVGIGSNKRISSQKRNRHFNFIIEKTKKQFRLPPEHLGYHQVIIPCNSIEEAITLEIDLILKFGRKDLFLGSLSNFTNGGDGMNSPSHETRIKLSLAHKGKRNSPEAYLKLSQSMKGNKRFLGKRHTLESRAKISKSRMGIKFSDEHRAKLSAWQLGRKLPKEHVEKIRKTLFGNKNALGPGTSKTSQRQKKASL